MDVHRKKTFNIPVFLHHINIRKRVKIIPHLYEHRFDKFFSQKISQNSSELSFFVKNSQNYRFLRRNLLADE